MDVAGVVTDRIPEQATDKADDRWLLGHVARIVEGPVVIGVGGTLPGQLPMIGATLDGCRNGALVGLNHVCVGADRERHLLCHGPGVGGSHHHAQSAVARDVEWADAVLVEQLASGDAAQPLIDRCLLVRILVVRNVRAVCEQGDALLG